MLCPCARHVIYVSMGCKFDSSLIPYFGGDDHEIIFRTFSSLPLIQEGLFVSYKP